MLDRHSLDREVADLINEIISRRFGTSPVSNLDSNLITVKPSAILVQARSTVRVYGNFSGSWGYFTNVELGDPEFEEKLVDAIKRLEKPKEGTMKQEAINGHLVEYNDSVVLVDGVEIKTDADYKKALGLSPDQSYPHPHGWTSDWATLSWLRETR